jgi:O-antigen/teichoic acid export membrane protein
VESLRTWFRQERERLGRWAWLLLSFFFSQAIVQALGFLSGVIVIRALTKDDYASYAIIFTMGPVIGMFTDNGVTAGFSGVGRRIWQDDERMGRLVSTGLRLRRQFSSFSFLVIGPILGWMLYRNHAPFGLIVALMIVTLAGTWFQLTSGVMKAVLELRQHVTALRNVSVVVALMRFALIAAFAGLLAINVFWAMLATTCSLLLEVVLLVRLVRSQIRWNAPTDPDYRASMLSMVQRTAPLSIYYCIQSQVSIWLISIFGTPHQVADIGALGRIGMLFALVGSVYATIVVPRFARNNGRARLRAQLALTLVSFLAIVFGMVLLAWLFPWPLLFILGPKYAQLTDLVWLVVLSTGLGSFLTLIGGLNASKGWVPPAYLTIPVEVVTQVVLLLTLDLSQSVFPRCRPLSCTSSPRCAGLTGRNRLEPDHSQIDHETGLVAGDPPRLSDPGCVDAAAADFGEQRAGAFRRSHHAAEFQRCALDGLELAPFSRWGCAPRDIRRWSAPG